MIKVEAKKNNLKDQYGEMFDFHFFSFFKFPALYFFPFNFYILPTTFLLKLNKLNWYCQYLYRAWSMGSLSGVTSFQNMMEE